MFAEINGDNSGAVDLREMLAYFGLDMPKKMQKGAFEVKVVNPQGLEVLFQFFADDAADPDAAVSLACTKHGFQPHNACMDAMAPLLHEEARRLRQNNRSKLVRATSLGKGPPPCAHARSLAL